MIELKEILEVQNGFAFKTEFFCEENGIPLIRIRDLDKQKTVINYCGDYRDEFVVNRGDYLIGMDGDFKCHQWKGAKSLLNQRVCRLRNFSDAVIPEYIYYGLQRKLLEIHAATAFVTVKHISSKQILGIKIPLPPLPEQRRIVDILNHAHSIQRLRREAIATTRAMIPALFVEMFGDPIKAKFQLLDDLADVVSGVTKGRKFKDKKTVIVPYVRVANVQDGFLDLSEIKTIEALPSDLEKYALKKSDVLLTEGGDYDKLGRGAMLEKDMPNCIHQNHVFRVRVNQKKLNPLFFAKYLLTSGAKMYFLKSAKQTTNLASIAKLHQLLRLPVLQGRAVLGLAISQAYK